MAVLVLLLPLWAVGMFGRNLWTPDEPREAAIALAMARDGLAAVPMHAGEPFCEKPPLTYWAAAPFLDPARPSPALARLPNLAYALAGAAAVAALAWAAGGALAAAVAAVAWGTLGMALQTEVWCATDAPLMAGVAVALAGLFRGLHAAPGGAKLGWYLLAHAGLLMGFFSKNAVAWMVPGLAFAGIVLWERRWRELARWELHLGWVPQLAAIGPWVLAVAGQPDGGQLLKVFFVDNLLGRFVQLDGVAYGEGHRNWPGKYLLQFPLFCLPWTLALAAAAVRGWGAVRGGDPAIPAVERSAWRFAVAGALPFVLLLSLSRTARGLYIAPAMPLVAVLLGLWAARWWPRPGRAERWAWHGTVALIAAVALLAPPVVAWLWRLDGRPWWPGLALLPVGMALALLCLDRARRSWDARPAAAAWFLAAALVTGLLAPVTRALPVVNRWRDLEPIASGVALAARGAPLALWQPDETLHALLEWHGVAIPPRLDELDELATALADPRQLLLVRIENGPGAVEWLEHYHRLVVVEKLGHPHGRRYAVMGHPRR
ncbi:MAG: hypothetical protein L6R48_08805 [Planctomycetes bacterium]|nr:hypothetical protein [Planctomycetota bacterium]